MLLISLRGDSAILTFHENPLASWQGLCDIVREYYWEEIRGIWYKWVYDTYFSWITMSEKNWRWIVISNLKKIV